jgi:hypothetical protein
MRTSSLGGLVGESHMITLREEANASKLQAFGELEHAGSVGEVVRPA